MTLQAATYRATLRSEFNALVSAAAASVPGGAVAYERFTGSKRGFNRGGVFPKIGSGDPPPGSKKIVWTDSRENPPSRTYEVSVRFSVYVSVKAADLNEATQQAAENEADQLLGHIEAELAGVELPSGYFVELVSGGEGAERLDTVDDDGAVRMFDQLWQVQAVIENPCI